MPTETVTSAVFIEGSPLDEVRLLDLSGGIAAAWSSPSPEREDSNEDAAMVLSAASGAILLAVADGVGGLRGGAAASRLALETLAAAVDGADQASPDLRSAILDGLELANRRILSELPGAGTTIAVAEIVGRRVRPYHVGDSMILSLGQRGRLKLQTVAHSPVGYAVESGLLDEDEALHHEERHLISNMLGSPEMRIEVGSPTELSPRDTLVLATDGLSDNLTTEEIVEAVRAGSLEKAAGRAGRDARARMLEPRGDHPSKPDDLTFILYRPRSR